MRKKCPVGIFISYLAIFREILKINNLATLQLAPQTQKESENWPIYRLSWHVKSILTKQPEFSQNFSDSQKKFLIARRGSNSPESTNSGDKIANLAALGPTYLPTPSVLVRIKIVLALNIGEFQFQKGFHFATQIKHHY